MAYTPGFILNDKYQIIEKLGSGAMGEVYRAEHIKLHKEVAIKVMHVRIAENKEALKRFKREAYSAAKLEHPHICAVTDFDVTDDGDFYLVMEYLHGETLRTRIQREKSIPVMSALRIMDDLLSALECAHEYGIVHRDIKPDNIILNSRDDRTDYVKLIDFGIAHTEISSLSHNEALTKAGQVYGTPQYLSPEQALGEPVDLRSDLYSCGCTLFEMLVGEPPFSDQNYIVLLNKHVALEPPPLPSSIPCSVELNLVIQKLLKKDPSARFSTAHETRAILNEIRGLLVTSSSQSAADANPLHNFLVNHDALRTAVDSGSDEAENVPTDMDSIDVSQVRKAARMNNTEPVIDVPQMYRHPHHKAIIAAAIVVGLVIILMGIALISSLKKQNELDGIVQKLNEHLESSEAMMNERMADLHKHDHLKYELSPDVLRNYIESECRIADDPQMNSDPELRAGAEECLLKNYEKAKEHFDKVKDKFADNLHFQFIYMTIVYQLGDTDETIKSVLHLFNSDSAAVCEPSVREIIYALYENHDAYEQLSTQLKVIDNPRIINGLAWLILLTPCNRYEVRFNNLLATYDARLEDGNRSHIQWLADAVRVWRPFKASGSCDKRQKYVDDYVMNGLHDFCDSNDPVKLATQPKSRCTICYDVWKARTGEDSPEDPRPDDAKQ